jgi:hypothetical protein
MLIHLVSICGVLNMCSAQSWVLDFLHLKCLQPKDQKNKSQYSLKMLKFSSCVYLSHHAFLCMMRD